MRKTAAIAAVIICAALSALAAVLCSSTGATARPSASLQSLRAPHRMLSAWLPTWDGGAGYRQVLAHASEFRFVSPYWYATTADPATIGLNIPSAAGTPRPAWVAALHARGIAVVPTVRSRWTPEKAQQVFTSTVFSQQHAHTLVDLVLAHGYDGIDLDYEGFTWPRTEAQTRIIRRGFASFVSNLCSDLHAVGKLCTVTLGAVTAGGPRVVNDYRAIGGSADLVRLMCYDLHEPWGTPGPITTTAWTSRVLNYAVSQIPRSKLELDVPTYGYEWPAPANGDASLTWAQTQALIRAHHLAGAVRYDANAGEARVRWRSGGRLHTVWFETARSLGTKIELANRFRLRSVGFWLLGHEAPGDWQALHRLTLPTRVG
jgi:spore germination protein YaaH